MSLAQRIVDELKRSPITVSATVAGVAVSALGLLVAHLQHGGSVGPARNVASSAVAPRELVLSNLFLVVSFFLAVGLSAASVIRLIARRYPFAAFALSVVAATLAIFCTLVVLSLAPPREMTPAAIRAANDAVFYGMLVVFAAVDGLPVTRGLATASSFGTAREGESSQNTTADGLSLLILIGFTLGIWGALVGGGQSLLVRSFLE